MSEREDDSVLGFCTGCGHDITAWRAARAQDAERISELEDTVAKWTLQAEQIATFAAALEREQEARKKALEWITRQGECLDDGRCPSRSLVAQMCAVCRIHHVARAALSAPPATRREEHEVVLSMDPCPVCGVRAEYCGCGPAPDARSGSEGR